MKTLVTRESSTNVLEDCVYFFFILHATSFRTGGTLISVRASATEMFDDAVILPLYVSYHSIFHAPFSMPSS